MNRAPLAGFGPRSRRGRATLLEHERSRAALRRAPGRRDPDRAAHRRRMAERSTASSACRCCPGRASPACRADLTASSPSTPTAGSPASRMSTPPATPARSDQAGRPGRPAGRRRRGAHRRRARRRAQPSRSSPCCAAMLLTGAGPRSCAPSCAASRARSAISPSRCGGRRQDRRALARPLPRPPVERREPRFDAGRPARLVHAAGSSGRAERSSRDGQRARIRRSPRRCGGSIRRARAARRRSVYDDNLRRP